MCTLIDTFIEGTLEPVAVASQPVNSRSVASRWLAEWAPRLSPPSGFVPVQCERMPDCPQAANCSGECPGR
jgi:hypothetical protein